MRKLLTATPARRFLGLVCLIALFFSAAVAAMPVCCDDECAAEEASCVDSCGPCATAFVASGALPPTALLASDGFTAPLVEVAAHGRVRDILHVPLAA